MAEVLPPLTSPTSTITMLHPRPSSSDAFQGSQQQYSSSSSSQRNTQNPRSPYNGQMSGYRGTPPPVQPYAFQSTPHLKADSRAISAPTTSHGPVTTGMRHKHSPSASASTTSSDASSQPSARDDSVMGSSKSLSGINLGWQLPDLTLPSFEQPVKSSPERYRRPAQKRSESNTQGPAARVPQPLTDEELNIEAQRSGSVDDMAVPRPGQPELAKRYRRRSLNQLDTSNIMNPPVAATNDHGPTSTPTTIRPVSLHQDAKNVDGEGIPQMLTSSAPRRSTETPKAQDVKQSSTTATVEQPKGVQVPARGSSEPLKRSPGPSPLSKQAEGPATTSASSSPSKPKTYAAAAQSAIQPPSPAAAHLAAVSDRDLNKGMKSRLRRAFSFGSEQQLKRAGETNQTMAQQAQQTRQQHQQSIDDELDAEQLEIARRQEAAGIGAGIYSGQGGFAGSTDNLSISSTASSASMMLRKMGRGAKKGAKNIKGLFRPKSVVGVPAADGPVLKASLAEVSMVTVEAERQNVNVNAHVEETSSGATGFPKLERNSLDAATASTPAPLASASATGGEGHAPTSSIDGSVDSHSRRSIVGSDKDRAEVLAAVKKGILKRSGTASPNGSPVIRPSDAAPSHLVESPSGSLAGSPRDPHPHPHPHGHPPTPLHMQARSASMTTNSHAGPGGDYFVHRSAVPKSLPGTPNGSGSVRSISFSPRIQFHDVWSSADYDRRSEVATCNRLTPLLAQQIKEELNTFKMEMEVHELSKPHTHFF